MQNYEDYLRKNEEALRKRYGDTAYERLAESAGRESANPNPGLVSGREWDAAGARNATSSHSGGSSHGPGSAGGRGTGMPGVQNNPARTENSFYTNNGRGGIINMPRYDTIEGYMQESDGIRKDLDMMNEIQYGYILKNDAAGMRRIDPLIASAEKRLADVETETAAVMGIGGENAGKDVLRTAGVVPGMPLDQAEPVPQPRRRSTQNDGNDSPRAGVVPGILDDEVEEERERSWAGVVPGQLNHAAETWAGVVPGQLAQQAARDKTNWPSMGLDDLEPIREDMAGEKAYWDEYLGSLGDEIMVMDPNDPMYNFKQDERNRAFGISDELGRNMEEMDVVVEDKRESKNRELYQSITWESDPGYNPNNPPSGVKKEDLPVDPGISVDLSGPEYRILKENLGGSYNAAVFLAEQILDDYGQNLVDERTFYGLATEIYIHDFVNTIEPRDGNSQFSEYLKEQKTHTDVLQVIYENDANTERAEQIAGFMGDLQPGVINEAAMQATAVAFILNDYRTEYGNGALIDLLF